MKLAFKTGVKSPHSGGFIKRAVLPNDLSVTAATEALGEGRHALSNLLNERASLSPEMALLVENAFGVKVDRMLRIQARYDSYHKCQRETENAVNKYALA